MQTCRRNSVLLKKGMAVLEVPAPALRPVRMALITRAPRRSGRLSCVPRAQTLPAEALRRRAWMFRSPVTVVRFDALSLCSSSFEFLVLICGVCLCLYPSLHISTCTVCLNQHCIYQCCLILRQYCFLSSTFQIFGET